MCEDLENLEHACYFVWLSPDKIYEISGIWINLYLVRSIAVMSDRVVITWNNGDKQILSGNHAQTLLRQIPRKPWGIRLKNAVYSLIRHGKKKFRRATDVANRSR